MPDSRSADQEKPPGSPASTVLVVLERPGQARLLRQAFASPGAGLRVVLAASLAEARSYLARGNPALAVLDRVLPDGRASELFPVEQGHPAFPVIILTDPGDSAEPAELDGRVGSLDYLAKSDAVLLALPQIAELALRRWRDSLEHRKAAEALRISEARFRGAFETAAHGMALVGTDGHFQQVNQAFCTMLGYSEAELLATDFQSLTHPEDLGKGPDCIRQLLAGETLVCHFEKRYYHKQGSIIWALLSVTLVRDGMGNPLHLVAQILDITERKQGEEKLREANRELEAFVHTISHDLRTPLTPIIGFAGYLKETYQGSLDSHATEILGDIETQGNKMLVLLEDLLELAQAGHLKRPRRPVCTEEIVSEVIETLKSQFPHAAANMEIAPPLPPVRAPRTLLFQLFSNLIGNAFRYGLSAKGPVQVGGERNGGRVRFFIRDHGPGIPAEERERIFALFYRGTTGRDNPGTGIGLATVRKIAQSFEGRCWVEETPGGGSTFWVELGDPPAEE
ncbi:hypothetical protein DESUT3_34400 [Desulfuromonas versatilis]|uniref:histidine kinase n=1 Tax=Desulfuromonas versatilis TaxID=2802975 RepID=A0ABM8HWI4_9BACT|nr:hybrid sensor histidine kinase/response regulator [Desulfuromonas versatilis]BCR06371.1 hypothetical protein DESUT3_34400 [Desulfuromonas versatilis]